jgi:nitrite reductase/ring-hydroxylating ferredoxin subunit
MADQEDWVDIGSAEDLARIPLKSCKAQATAIAISFKDGQFGAVSNVCNHVGGPLGEGRLDGDYITCPWHGWKFHRLTGVGEPGFEEDRVPAFPVKVESGRVLRSAPMTCSACSFAHYRSSRSCWNYWRAKLCKSIHIVNGLVPSNLSRALAGDAVGTLIHA